MSYLLIAALPVTEALPDCPLPFTPLPANEAERLEALRRYKILDTPPEVAFDRITALAARLFNVPIALVSLVDESRAWFKSCYGFDLQEVQRDDTICSFALLYDEVLIVPDAREDDRFACNPFVQQEPGLRFYAGAPLLTQDGLNLGTLCLLDTKPRDELTDEQKATLTDLAAMVMDELELRLAAHKIAQVDAALLEVTHGVSAVTGNAFFSALVQHLTKALDMKYACISMLVNEHPESLKTIAFCAQSQILDNMEYQLQDTPCLDVIRKQKMCCYPQGVQAFFPKDEFLASLSIESYAAIPFFDSAGRPLGLLSVMDSQPLENLQLVESLLTIFALRIATELERQQAEELQQATAQRLQLYADVVHNAQVGIVVWQLEDLNDPGSFRLRIANPAASETTGRDFETLIGTTMAESFPMLLQTSLVQQYMQVVRTGQALDLGEVSYSHDGITAGIYSLKAFSLPDHCLGLAFENITVRKHIETQLQESQHYNQQIAETMPGVLFVHDLIEQRNVYTNRQIADLLGYTSEQVQAMGSDAVPTLIHPDDLERILKYFEDFRSAPEGAVLGIEYRAHHANGEWRWMYSQSVVFNRTAEGLPRQILGVSLDISDRIQAELSLQESEARLKLAYKATRSGLWDWDISRNRAYVSEEYCALLGLDPTTQEVSFEQWLSVLYPDDRTEAAEAVRRAIQQQQEYDVSYRILHPQGIRWVASKGQVFYDAGNAVRMLGNLQDITDRKQAEIERDRLLEQEQLARTEAERANRVKDEFLAILSHELRSPLNPILGWSRLLRAGKLDATKTQYALTTIERNAKLQTQLIDDLLDVSRILQGKLNLTMAPVSLTSTIASALETVRLAAEAKLIHIQTTLDPTTGQVLGDAARLQQIVWNLLTNAVKFTAEGGRVVVELVQVGSQAQITVSDTGKGIHPDFLPHVFEYFRQADATTTRTFGGLGLGLAIVRHLVELHGGTVQADSPGEGQGATFTVRVPLLRTVDTSIRDEQADRSAITSEALSLGHLRILLVDDDDDTRDVIAFTLEQQGAVVTTAASAQEAWHTLAKARFDLLISDIGMPEMDGYMLMKNIRATAAQAGGAIPAIALTAYAGEINQKQALAAGFQKHLAKPIEPEELVRAIEALVMKSDRSN